MQKKRKRQIVSGYICPCVPKIHDRYLSIKRGEGKRKEEKWWRIIAYIPKNIAIYYVFLKNESLRATIMTGAWEHDLSNVSPPQGLLQRRIAVGLGNSFRKWTNSLKTALIISFYNCIVNSYSSPNILWRILTAPPEFFTKQNIGRWKLWIQLLSRCASWL